MFLSLGGVCLYTCLPSFCFGKLDRPWCCILLLSSGVMFLLVIATLKAGSSLNSHSRCDIFRECWHSLDLHLIKKVLQRKLWIKQEENILSFSSLITFLKELQLSIHNRPVTFLCLFHLVMDRQFGVRAWDLLKQVLSSAFFSVY